MSSAKCFTRTCDVFRVRERDGYNTKVNNLLKLFFVLTLVRVVQCSDNVIEKTETNDVLKRIEVVEAVAGRAFLGNNVYVNGTFRTGNSLWDNLLNQCTVHPTVSCLQKNVYSYLDDSLKFSGDVKVGGVCFKKNNVDINKYSKEANVIYLTGTKDAEERSLNEDNISNDIEDEEESESPIEEVTDALYDRAMHFLATHDIKLTLPEMFFEGATLKVSPRALTKTGALVHIDLEPQETNGEGRFFIKKIKEHIKKKIMKKLITAAIAIILVVKLLALKLIFVLPLILGVTTAKKMFIKMLLFMFPPLSYLFKMCSWYYQSYHGTKHHHHHHLISHHHKPHAHHPPVYHHSSHHAPHHASHHSPTVVVRPHAAGPPTFEHQPQDWELSGPGLGNEYISSNIHRNAIATFKPDVNDVNEINSWGLGFPPGTSMNVGEYASNNMVPNMQQPGRKPLSGNTGRPVGPPNPYNRHKKTTPKDPLQAEKEALIRAAAIAARAPPSAVRDEILRVSAVKLSETNRIQTETDLVKQQQQILAASDPETIAAEKFYGALLDKIDKILETIGAMELGCKERAVCALYRDPFRHSPYSNIVSNELSKDSSELLPPADSKKALQYYVYVQAARDGQETKDCVALYPACNLDFNK